MPSGSSSNADQALALTPGQKTATVVFTIATAGYASFADAISCLYMVKPIRTEYHFEDQVTPDQWFVVTVTIAGVYCFYTLSTEGKGSYDTARAFFLNRNRQAALRAYRELHGDLPELPFEEKSPPEREPAPASNPGCRQKLAFGSVWVGARLVSLVGSLADSTETTMGLVEEGAGMSKVIAVSTLSFLGSYSFYGSITVEAFEELFLGKKVVRPEGSQASYKLAKVIGYPIAFFSAIQDTLECGAGLFEKFEVTDTPSQWGLVSLSTLAGASSLCLDGRRGVEVLDDFFGHLETHYAWLPDSVVNRRIPTAAQLYRLGQEGSTLGLAGYGASFIAFADRELTIALTQGILKTLGAEVPVLSEILGWCVVLRDFVIQTNTLNRLERMLIHAAKRCLERAKQACSEGEPENEPVVLADLPEMEEVELAVLSAESKAEPPPEAEESDEEEEDEEAALLPQNRRPIRKESSWLPQFFQGKPRNPKRDYQQPERSWLSRLIW